MALHFVSTLHRFARRTTHRDPATDWPYQMPDRRFDERDIIQSRIYLKAGTPEFEAYYQRRPDLKPLDDKMRAAPGIHHPATPFFDVFQVAADQAAFAAVYELQNLVDGPPRRSPIPVEAAALTQYIHQWLRHMGALRSGIAPLRDYHLYSHSGFAFKGGKSVASGEPIENNHPWAIVLSVEMDEEMAGTAPAAAASAEAAKVYFDSGSIAVRCAVVLRELGYEARAHIFGNSQVQNVLLAKEAGIGEIGRMGLLLDPEKGPRVRLAVITTNAPLTPNSPTHDKAILDFCNLCNKCAKSCPAKAIPFDGPKAHGGEGFKRWRINSEACATFWHTSGAYCGRCLAVCPLQRVSAWLHPAIPQWIRRHALYQRLVLKWDDFWVGAKPRRRPVPSWMRFPKAPRGNPLPVVILEKPADATPAGLGEA